jgi:glycosyltransferase involved in cell wall biosynthesis
MVHATGLAIPPADGKLVATVHDLTVITMPQAVPAAWRRIYRKGLELAVERATVLCAVSEATKNELAEREGVDRDRIVVTPEAPNVTPESRRNDAIFDRLGLRAPYILTVGTVEPRKNQSRLVKAFASVAGELSDWSLVIAGIPGWGQEQVAAAVEASQLEHRIYLTGKVTTSELASLYARASIFALVSLYEGFGIPLAEALSFELPSLASATPALAELAGTAALTKEASDTDGIAQGLVALATDDQLRHRLTKEAKERAARLSWKVTAAKTLEAYAKAAER